MAEAGIDMLHQQLRYIGELKSFFPSAHPSLVSFIRTIKVEYCRLVNSSKDQLKGHFFLSTQCTEMKGASSTSNERIHGPLIKVGDVGFEFLKEFDDGWLNGRVAKICPNAKG